MSVKLKNIADQAMLEAAARFDACSDSVLSVLTNPIGTRDGSVDTEERRTQFLEREKHHAAKDGGMTPRDVVSSGIGLQRKNGEFGNLLSVEFLEAGVEAARAVGRLEFGFGTSFGTGFFVAPNLIMTNHHVLMSPQVAHANNLELYAESNRIPPTRVSQRIGLQPGRFFYSDPDLDVAIVAVENDVDTSDFGWLPLIAEQGKILIGHSVNLIQHPNGGEKMVVVHDSRLLHIENSQELDRYCWYSADTEEGSSGSPVFNNRWEVIAVHHKSIPARNISDEILDVEGRPMTEEEIRVHPDRVQWIANEGIRVSRIVEALREHEFENVEFGSIRDKVLALWADPMSFRPGIKSGWPAGW